jgi:hypothetical protein
MKCWCLRLVELPVTWLQTTWIKCNVVGFVSEESWLIEARWPDVAELVSFSCNVS